MQAAKTGDITVSRRRRPRIGRRAIVVRLAPIMEALDAAPQPITGGGKIWAIVAHMDDENAFLIPLMMLFLRASMGIRHNAVLVLTASGMPRSEDWPDIPVADLQGDILRDRYGILYVDSGGGELDQHVHAANRERSVLASADIVVEKHGAVLEELVPVLLPAYRLVARHDTHGEAAAVDKDFPASATPHTPRLLATVIQAWRALVRRGDRECTPERMVRNWFVSFLAALVQVSEAFETTPPEELEEAIEKFDARSQGIFLIANLTSAAERYFARTRYPKIEQERAARSYREDCERGLAVWEAEWRAAEKEFFLPGNVRCRYFRVPIRVLEDGMSQEEMPTPQERVVMVFTIRRAKSARIGAFMRRKGRKEFHRAPAGKREVVVHVTRPNGRWTVAADRAMLREVAAALRIAEVLKCGGTLLPNADLRATGNFHYRDGAGRRVEGTYFTSFQTVVGTHFDTNPDGIPPGLLTTAERHEVIARVLAGDTPTAGEQFACRLPTDPFCNHGCPLFPRRFEGCARFRAAADTAAATSSATALGAPVAEADDYADLEIRRDDDDGEGPEDDTEVEL